MIGTEAEYIALLVCAQEVKFVNMLLEEMTEVQKPSVVYEENKEEIFLANNIQVGICTNRIDICHHFMRYMVEEKYMEIKYIRSKENPADIMTKNFSETDYVKHTKRITEGELWDLMETGRENVKNNGVLDGSMDLESN